MHLAASLSFPSPAQLPSLVWAGCISGLQGGLLGVALVMLYRVTGVINLAVGAIYIVGAVIASEVKGPGALSLLLMLGLAALSGAGANLVQDVIVLRPLSHSQPATRLLSTMGFATLLEGIVILIWGDQQLTGPPLIHGQFDLTGSTVVTFSDILILTIAVVGAVTAQAWLSRSNAGRVVSAMTEDPAMAEILGIPAAAFRTILTGVFGALCGLFGAVAVSSTVTEPVDGLNFSLEAFIAAYLMGNGLSPALALGGGLAVGLVQAFASRIISGTAPGIVLGLVLIGVLVSRRKALVLAGA